MDRNIVYYPLTHPQKGIWYTEKLYPDTSIATISATLKLYGDIDYQILEKAINLLVCKNDGVRLRLKEINNEPYQYISEYKYKNFEFFDFSKNNITDLYNWDRELSEKPFEILDNDLFFFALVKIDDNSGGFFVKMHHLISDGWSMGIVGNSIVEYYTMLKRGIPVEPSLKPSYTDFMMREKEYIDSERFHDDKIFWMEKLSGLSDITALKIRKTHCLDTKARRKSYVLPKKFTDKLHAYCRETKISEYALFFAALSMYVNRITGKEDLIFGTTLLNRTNVKEKETFGMYVSTAVPLRIGIKDHMNLRMFAGYISGEILSVFRHQKFPYDILFRQTKEQNNSLDSLFNIVLSYQNSKFKKTFSEQYSTRWHFNGRQIESLIININDRDDDGKLIIDYDYLCSLFHATEIEFIHQHIISLLWHAIDNPEKPISKLEMISEEEKNKILYEFNNTDSEFPDNKTIQQIFEEQVVIYPNSTAAIYGNTEITYEELNHKVNQLARQLRSRGVKPNSVVAVMVNRSLEMLISILAIIKAGGAYLPIDPKCPAERAAYMLNDSNANILLTDCLPKNLSYFGGSILQVSDKELFIGDASNVENINKPDDLLYIIYTSGSTGNPKGVMIEHRGVVNRINWMQKKYPLTEESTILQKTTYTFDVSVWELLWWMFAGARVVFLQPEAEKEPEKIIEAIHKHNVTTLHFVPSMLDVFLSYVEETGSADRLNSLRQVFASGEALSAIQVENFYRVTASSEDVRLYNLYGPTEASIDVSYFDCLPNTKLSSVPIGRPIDNIKLLILDKNMNLLPVGVPGELYISGIGVARGYINNSELTNKKFTKNPFFQEETMYATGDLARWYPLGDIEYLGRIDTQIKIRGFRIELGEIERKLLEHGLVKHAIVIGRPNSSGVYTLNAYYVPDGDVQAEELKKYLLARLPDYMVPACFIKLDSLPLLSNGKVDRNSLPKAEVNIPVKTYQPPANSVEKELHKAWLKCLNLKDICVNDNIFELGADSLSIIQILTKIYKFNWNLSAADFYNNPTIRLLANRISGNQNAEELDDGNKIDINIPRLESMRKSKRNQKVKNILLTGATGFLGIHVLKEMIDETNVNVYCLIRGSSTRKAEERLKYLLAFYFTADYSIHINKRIFIINGDVGYDNFQLSSESVRSLAEKVDAVFHAAALVKYYGNYSEFENINVKGTKRIIDFCMQFRKKLVYASTLAVSGSYLTKYKGKQTTFSENDFYIGQCYTENVYVRSKFEAEREVLTRIKEGLDATILRIGNLTGRYSDGQFQNNIADNAFYNIIKSIQMLAVIPDDQLNIDVEITPVDLAARAIRLLLNNKESSIIYHVMNPKEINIGKLISVFSESGTNIRVVKRDVFHKTVYEASNDSKRQEILNGIIADMSKNSMLDYRTEFAVDSSKTNRLLEAQGFKWPEITNEYIHKILYYMKVTGFIENLS